jgi:hypothetical protein
VCPPALCCRNGLKKPSASVQAKRFATRSAWERHARLGTIFLWWAECKAATVPVQLPLAASELAFGHARADVTGKRARRRLKRNVQKHIAERAEQRRTVAFVNVVVKTIGNDGEDAHLL